MRTKCTQDERRPLVFREKPKSSQSFLSPTKKITTLVFQEPTNEMEGKKPLMKTLGR